MADTDDSTKPRFHCASTVIPDLAGKTIAVDLTPLLPGAANGAAKMVALVLCRALAAQAPETQFLLACKSDVWEELAGWETSNIKRLSAGSRPDPEPAPGRRLLNRLLARLGMAKGPDAPPLLEDMGADLLFCPFTAPTLFDPAIPAVCVVHDLQHQAYPGYFTPAEFADRERTYRQAVEWSSLVVCVSEHCRRSVLEAFGTPPERVRAILHRLHWRLEQPLAPGNAVPEDYFFYPANFWPHKNHATLIQAFALLMEKKQWPGLKLVLSGGAGPTLESCRSLARDLGLDEAVVFAGYVDEQALAGLYQGCRALVVPSRFEGFGLPLLEAMGMGKPVLCSDAASLPEVGGEAALYCNADDAPAMAGAMERLLTEPGLAGRLGRLGLERAKAFGRVEDMAGDYLAALSEALANPRPLGNRLFGAHPDGWAGPLLTVAADLPAEGRLQLELYAPAGLPHRQVEATVNWPGGSKVEGLARGDTLKLDLPLPAGPSLTRIRTLPVFQPRSLWGGQDRRWLGLMVRSCLLEAEGFRLELPETGES